MAAGSLTWVAWVLLSAGWPPASAAGGGPGVGRSAWTNTRDLVRPSRGCRQEGRSSHSREGQGSTWVVGWQGGHWALCSGAGTDTGRWWWVCGLWRRPGLHCSGEPDIRRWFPLEMSAREEMGSNHSRADLLAWWGSHWVLWLWAGADAGAGVWVCGLAELTWCWAVGTPDSGPDGVCASDTGCCSRHCPVTDWRSAAACPRPDRAARRRHRRLPRVRQWPHRPRR